MLKILAQPEQTVGFYKLFIAYLKCLGLLSPYIYFGVKIFRFLLSFLNKIKNSFFDSAQRYFTLRQVSFIAGSEKRHHLSRGMNEKRHHSSRGVNLNAIIQSEEF